MIRNAYSPDCVFNAYTGNGEMLAVARVLIGRKLTVKDAFCVRSDDGAFICFNPREMARLAPTFLLNDQEHNSPLVTLREAIEGAYRTRAEFMEAVSAVGERMPKEVSQ